MTMRGWVARLDPARQLAGRLLRRVGVLDSSAPAPPKYADAELLARADEFNRNAEAHWQSIEAEPAGRAHVLNKPFSTVSDTPEILYRLGLLLSALEPGVGQTILDFGAGSCWLSSCLNRLRCRTISVDVSPTALQLGKELFRLDPRHHLDLNPEFRPYDGHRIPADDASVDRVACFDAFHHVPNQDAVLNEWHRVLKPGGRAVLAEPGEGHSHVDGAAYETAMCGVLENDMDVANLADRARRAGFDRVMLKPYPDAAAMTVTAAEYIRLLDGDRSSFPFRLLQGSLRHHYLVILTKGTPRLDSRRPGILKARIRVPDGLRDVSDHAGSQQRLIVNLRNDGDTIWLHAVDPAGGYVALGSHLLDAERRLLRRGFHRTLLPRDIGPGETVDVEVAFALPEEVGRYVLRLDLVDEYVAWFEQTGSEPAEVALVVDGYRDSRAPGRLAARLEPLDVPHSGPVRPGSPLSLSLRVTNAGDTLWLHGPLGAVGTVALGAHLLDASGAVLAQDFFRVPLEKSLGPGETLDVECVFTAPPRTGCYLLRVDLVVEGRVWFEQHGGQPLDLVIETSGEMPDSLHPGLLRASIELAPVPHPLRGRPGATVRFPVRIRNEGNTLWLAAPQPARGHVSLGGHLRALSGDLPPQDWFRTPLPESVAPGEEVALECELPVPNRAGEYRIELDLVDEGITWFSEQGSPAAIVELVATEHLRP